MPANPIHMKYSISLTILTVLLCVTACSGKQQQITMTRENATLVTLETTEGNIVVHLFDETPLHKANFLKLVIEGVYDSTLFHRVIKDFMIQAGDPNSKTAEDTATLGDGDVGYTVPAEFRPELFHKRGVLAAARQGDNVNPERASSGCQFYIVLGKVYTEAQLINMQNRMKEARLNQVFDTLVAKHRKKIYKLRKKKDQEGLYALQDSLEAETKKIVEAEPPIQFSPAQIQAYTTVGGTPHLDGAYTVFGEVVEGIEVAEKIGKAATGANDRPTQNIRILKAYINQ